MARSKNSSPVDFLRNLCPATDIRRRARELGVVKRTRKVDIYAFFLAIVLTVTGRGGQSIAALHRAFILRGGPHLSKSGFWRRINPDFGYLLLTILKDLQNQATARKPQLCGVLAAFRDVVAVDATVITLLDALADKWPGTRKNRPAAIKVHTWIRALTGELLKHKITGERHADGKAFGVNWSDRGTLFLFDRGYPSASMWWRIHRVGAYFLTRLPGSYLPKVASVNRSHRGRSRGLLRQDLREVSQNLRRKIIDVNAVFRVHIRAQGRKRGRYEWPQFRVVGIRNDAGDYDFFVTNIPPRLLAGEAFWFVYRLRWEVETFYKTAKSGLGLNELAFTKPHVIEIFVRAALLRASVAMQAKQAAERKLPRELWINPGQWLTVWRQVVEHLIEKLLEVRRHRLPWTWTDLAFLATDPNRSRPPMRHVFTTGINFRAFI